MGNCQAIDAAALVIQHPNGRIDRLYWPVTASEVMKTNPGHYVSLIIPLPSVADSQEGKQDQKTVRFTRVKLLRPSDILALGHAYRLLTSQEVMKVLQSKKYAKTRRWQQDSVENSQTPQEKLDPGSEAEGKSDKENTNQGLKHERHRRRTPLVNPAAVRSKSWQPSLQSISEASS